MIIDIEPIKVQPNDFYKVVMEVKEYDKLYMFMKGGKEYSVFWTEETLKDFLPRYTISEFIESHYLNYISMFCRCHSHIVQGFHPFWTVQDRDENGRPTGRGEVPQKLSGDSRVKSTALYRLKNSYEQFTKTLEFVVITNE
jgi:hypothetical protein